MKSLITKPWIYNTAPVVIWFLLLILPFLSGSGNLPADVKHQFLLNVAASNFLLLCLFYVHTYFIYPMLNTKGIGWYVGALVLTLVVYWICAHFVEMHHHHWWGQEQQHLQHEDDKHNNFNNHPGPPGGPRNFFPVFGPLVALLCSFCYRVILDNAARQQLLNERETIHLKTELNFLRSQISPHFMFNILNNLVSLARKKSDDLEPAIINLSQLMRYMLYESDDNRVLLNKEIEYLNSYIKLQMLRFGNSVNVHTSISGHTDFYTIEPMLLIPFIENAFKHGTGMIESPVILIVLEIDDEKRTLHFKVVNAVSPLDVSKDQDSGIGLSNVQRRLAILYPGKHELRIINHDNSFTTELRIVLA